jgi:hypothetical protein
LSREFDVPIDALWSWLEELERCDVWMRLNPQAKHAALTRDVQTSEVIYGNPWYFFSDPRNDRERIEQEVRTKIAQWFETEEEPFQRFQLTRSRPA